MTPSPGVAAPGSVQRQRRALLVVDLVESVRLILEHENDVVQRWRAFIARVRSEALPRHGGRLVKSLGDGLLMDFTDPAAAVATGLDLHRLALDCNAGQAADRHFALRAGVHVAEVVVDDIDVFGAGVNLAARLLDLARPGDTVITADVRDVLVDGLDGELQDLGECFLKHLPQAVRAFRVHAVGLGGALPWTLPSDHLAAVAVVPFLPLSPADGPLAVGDAFADAVIGALSRVDGLRLTSRLSTAVLRHGGDRVQRCRQLLGAQFVLTGHYVLRGTQVHVRAELTETRSNTVLWAGGCEGRLQQLFDADGVLVMPLVLELARAIVRSELQRARGLPIQSLENFTLYVGGLALMHRMSQHEFSLAREMLDLLAHRLPRNAAPRAMLAKWHLMRLLQGWSSDPARDGRLAQDLARRALDRDPEHAFALATEGFVAAHFGDDLPLALQRCQQALSSDPQDAQAWRMLAGVHSYLGDGPAAEAAALRAVSLTPLDPTRFVYDVIVGAAKLAGGAATEAVQWAESSIRRNAMHVPAHRLRIIALVQSDQAAAAADAARTLMSLSPGFRVDAFAARYPGRDHPHASGYFAALRSAGLPG